MNVLIVGLGLIGASLAKALNRDALNGGASNGNVLESSYHVMGFDANAQSIEYALEHNIIKEGDNDLAVLVSKADLIVVAVPMLAFASVLNIIKHHQKEDVIITDVGSVKNQMVSAAFDAFGHWPTRLIPGHPIAGAEKSGVTAANECLFNAHQVILTPSENVDSNALNAVQKMWQSVGALVVSMSVTEHDEVLAATSHLPHLLAFSLVNTLAQESDNQEIFHFAAGGFRDFTRIAASDPVMWHDIFKSNTKATLKILDKFTEDLAVLREHVATGDGEAMKKVFSNAKINREYFAEIIEERQQKFADDNK